MKDKSGNVFDLKIFKRLLIQASAYKSYFYGSAFLAISLALIAAIRPYLLIDAVDNYITNKDGEGLLNISMLILIVLLIEVAFQLGFIYLVNWMGQHIIKDIRVKIFNHINHFKMSYFDQSSVGRLVTRVVNDVESIAQFFGQGLFMIVSDLLKMGVVAGLMLYKNWQLALISFAILPLLIYATKIFQRAIKSSFQQVRTQVANLNGFVQERIIGMKIVQIFSREKTEYKKFLEINELHKKAHVKTVWYFSIFFPVAEIMSSIAIGLLVWFGGLNLALEGTVTAGEIIGFITMTEMLFRPLRQIADKFTTLQMGMVAGDRVFQIIDTDAQIQNKGRVEKEKINGNITFDNVHFSYKKNEPIIKGIDLKIHSGQTIAIVGATGAGKSTIINLINRFYEIDKGSISIDDTNINDLTLQNLRSHVAIVLQDVFLFSDSIYNNITLQNESISKDQVIAAAKEIGIHEFIMSLPGGYDFNVKERGQMLSSGQRQLIAFLRAYLCKPSILILDEATSSVDSHAEQMIQYATEKITHNRTSIVIAHRLATITQADQIVVMDKGLIVEKGNHKELLKIQGGFYQNLYNKQFSQNKIQIAG